MPWPRREEPVAVASRKGQAVDLRRPGMALVAADTRQELGAVAGIAPVVGCDQSSIGEFGEFAVALSQRHIGEAVRASV